MQRLKVHCTFPLSAAFFCRALLPSMLLCRCRAVVAVVSNIECLGGFWDTAKSRISPPKPATVASRILPSSASLVRIGPDTRISLSSPAPALSSALSASLDPTPADNPVSPWKTFKATRSVRSPVERTVAGETPSPRLVATICTPPAPPPDPVLSFSDSLVPGPERQLWAAISLQVAACRARTPLPRGTAQRAVLLHGPDGVDKGALVIQLARRIAEAGVVPVQVVQVHVPGLLLDPAYDALPALRLAAAFRLAAASPARRLPFPSSSSFAAISAASEDTDLLSSCRAVRTASFPPMNPAGSAGTFPISAAPGALSILLIENVEALSATAGMSSAAARLFQLLKRSLREWGEECDASSPLLVVGTATSADAVDASLLSPRGFCTDIALDIPSPDQRLAVFKRLVAGAAFSEVAAELPAAAALASGLSASDMSAACNGAVLAALQRRWDTSPLSGDSHDTSSSAVHEATVRTEDLTRSIAAVRARAAPAAAAAAAAPQSIANTFASLAPHTKGSACGWDSIAGMAAVIARLRQAVEAPLLRSAEHLRMGVSPPRGVLLYGPPGNSKTSLVRALAASLTATFLPVKGAEVYSAFVGEAERAIRDLFRRARALQPSVVFLDEIDALVGSRGIAGSGSGRGK